MAEATEDMQPISPIDPAPSEHRREREKTRPVLSKESAGKATSGPKKRSMFGLLVGTLEAARTQTSNLAASESYKKRLHTESRLRTRLEKESKESREVEESKKERTAVTRKEESLVARDGVHKLRRKLLPLLSNFLCTSDDLKSKVEEISQDTDETMDTEGETKEIKSEDEKHQKLLASLQPPRSHPPPIYYLPKVLTKEQEDFINSRKGDVETAVEAEWSAFKVERTTAIDELKESRIRVQAVLGTAKRSSPPPEESGEGMDTDELGRERRKEKEEKEKEERMDVDPGAGDDEEAVEY